MTVANEKTGMNITLKLAVWTGAWVMTMAVATFGPEIFWPNSLALALLGVGINTAVGFGMILTNIQLIQQLDELQRKIHLDAMAITLGLSLVAGLSFSTLANIDAIPLKADISFLVIFMGVTYMIALLVGNRRYQ
jgi:ABC-type lipoprotein release transport system permease subunit